MTTGLNTTTYWCEYAWLPSGVVNGALLEIEGARIAAVSRTDSPPPHAESLRGLTIPGLANAHSHAFHRALRGRTSGGRGTFWTWRDQMYSVAEKLDPDRYYQLARAVYAEMVLAGMTSVGEFHYVHHAPGGRGYDDPNAMNAALVAAASDAGIRLTLLDTCYLAGGFDADVTGVQLRYADGDVDGWLSRVDKAAGDSEGVLRGAAIHSVRAVPAAAIEDVAGWANRNEVPLHVHLSEQRTENAACLAAHGCTPTELLGRHGALGADTTAVHATHLAAADTALLGSSRTGVCLCPTTESDLADGIGPATELAVAGSPLSVGSDGHSVIDPFTEIQAVEGNTRLSTETRGSFGPTDLIDIGAESGQRSLGWHDAGRLDAGARADLVTIGLDNPRLAGVPPGTALVAARGDDVHHVVVDGRAVVRDSRHHGFRDLGRSLTDAIEAVT